MKKSLHWAEVHQQNRLEELSPWPSLPWQAWHQTATTLQLWTQVIGKIKLKLATPLNHWWHVTLRLTSQGLTTDPMPYGSRRIQIDFDFIHHSLIFTTSTGQEEKLPLAPMSVAEFYNYVMRCLERLSYPVQIWTIPVEIPTPIPFEQDDQHGDYDAEYAHRFWQVLLQTERVFTEFRSHFIGKVSPVHFFWGSFDLAVTRFSGRRAPVHSSVPYLADHVVQTAYSHEVSSCGFWPGGLGLPEPIFFAYAYPAPLGYQNVLVQPEFARFNEALGEFILPYEQVRQSENPDRQILAFLQSTYEIEAQLAQWNREELERASPQSL